MKYMLTEKFGEYVIKTRINELRTRNATPIINWLPTHVWGAVQASMLKINRTGTSLPYDQITSPTSHKQ
jgi:hypothetical protein